MYKTELVEEMMKRIPEIVTSKKQGNVIAETFCDIVKDAVADGEDVRLLGFGTFSKASRAPRKYRDLNTGEVKETKKTVVPTFKPAEAFKEAVKPKRGRPKKK